MKNKNSKTKRKEKHGKLLSIKTEWLWLASVGEWQKCGFEKISEIVPSLKRYPLWMAQNQEKRRR